MFNDVIYKSEAQAVVKYQVRPEAWEEGWPREGLGWMMKTAKDGREGLGGGGVDRGAAVWMRKATGGGETEEEESYNVEEDLCRERLWRKRREQRIRIILG